ncbi:DapH/DapD/GlmU-related protein [Hafnia psychrotolerans]|uniref:Sugar O-acetyltransferase n=1 Tax=Hafnia psychrotolerans TaxID=1477018 RepID=A0ABQ1GJH5_9GAMM|nr:DapH/DapD/GlmU-related protein [Hafnia psychrotolerans]GGA45109.1 hypothetical protein GCM10011328_20330 [Hafnia psychrotolerans]
MLIYYLSGYCKVIKPARARNIFNVSHLESKKRNKILSKSEIVFEGNSSIIPPFFYEFGRIKIHDNVYINAGCIFLDNNNISIGCNTLIGPNVTLTSVTHPVDPAFRNTDIISSPIVIGDNVWIGAGVVVLPGVQIGRNSVIAANSVVKSDVPENVLFAGCPAVFKRNL